MRRPNPNGSQQPILAALSSPGQLYEVHLPVGPLKNHKCTRQILDALDFPWQEATSVHACISAGAHQS